MAIRGEHEQRLDLEEYDSVLSELLVVLERRKKHVRNETTQDRVVELIEGVQTERTATRGVLAMLGPVPVEVRREHLTLMSSGCG